MSTDLEALIRHSTREVLAQGPEAANLGGPLDIYSEEIYKARLGDLAALLANSHKRWGSPVRRGQIFEATGYRSWIDFGDPANISMVLFSGSGDLELKNPVQLATNEATPSSPSNIASTALVHALRTVAWQMRPESMEKDGITTWSKRVRGQSFPLGSAISTIPYQAEGACGYIPNQRFLTRLGKIPILKEQLNDRRIDPVLRVTGLCNLAAIVTNTTVEQAAQVAVREAQLGASIN